MPTRRGGILIATGLATGILARLIGAPAVEVAGAGLMVLPLVAWAWVVSRPRPERVQRRCSSTRVGPDDPLRITIEVRGPTGRSRYAGLVAVDRLPPTLGGEARVAIIEPLAGDEGQGGSHEIPARGRGRYRFGPIALEVRDPLGLTRRRWRFDAPGELLVTPRIEDLVVTTDGRGRGTATSPGSTGHSLRLLRSNEEFSGIRSYREGDDLRGIHWPSVARTGELMIRLGESAGRSKGLLFVDTRTVSLGRAGTPTFERGVSAAASIGSLLLRETRSVGLATAGAAYSELERTPFLETLAELTHEQERLPGALGRLRAAATTETTLIVVMGLPERGDLSAMIRAGTAFGQKLIVIVRPSGAPQLDEGVSAVTTALGRAGWDPLVLGPEMTLEEGWRQPPARRPLARAR
jgi:uncharacterized protein (DUF58 family)